VEFAIVMPVLLVMLVGLWEVGRMVTVTQLLANAAREGGRQASTGSKSIAQVKDAVVTYLTVNGITKVTTSDVTVVNLTPNGAVEPTSATQMDQFQVIVTIPFNNVRWIMLDQITSTTTLSGRAEWYSMRDVPLVVTSTIPLN
jgi:Flp pilus assembly protein TadG